MFKFIIVIIVAWFIGVWGWCQIIGSIQNIFTRKRLLFTLFSWIVIMIAGAHVAIYVFDSWQALLIGYGISLLQVLSAGKIE